MTDPKITVNGETIESMPNEVTFTCTPVTVYHIVKGDNYNYLNANYCGAVINDNAIGSEDAARFQLKQFKKEVDCMLEGTKYNIIHITEEQAALASFE